VSRIDNTVIVVNQQPAERISAWPLIFFLVLLAGAVIKYWAFFLAAAVVTAAVVWIVQRHRAEMERINGLNARADQQHNWVLADDERGVYG
jgi:hypothetical protein